MPCEPASTLTPWPPVRGSSPFLAHAHTYLFPGSLAYRLHCVCSRPPRVDAPAGARQRLSPGSNVRRLQVCGDVELAHASDDGLPHYRPGQAGAAVKHQWKSGSPVNLLDEVEADAWRRLVDAVHRSHRRRQGIDVRAAHELHRLVNVNEMQLAVGAAAG